MKTTDRVKLTGYLEHKKRCLWAKVLNNKNLDIIHITRINELEDILQWIESGIFDIEKEMVNER